MFHSNTLIKHTFTVIGTLMISLFVLLVVIFLYPVNIINVKCPIEISNKNVKINHVLSYQLEYNKHYNIPEIISQQLTVGSNIVLYESLYTHLKPNKGVFDLKIMIPSDVGVGIGKVKVVVRYKLFWNIRIVDVVQETESFNIIKDGVINE
jgi:hypothetical protein